MWKDGVEELGVRLNDKFRRGEINEQFNFFLIQLRSLFIGSVDFISGSERGPSDLGTFPPSPSTPSPFSGVFLSFLFFFHPVL